MGFCFNHAWLHVLTVSFYFILEAFCAAACPRRTAGGSQSFVAAVGERLVVYRLETDGEGKRAKFERQAHRNVAQPCMSMAVQTANGDAGLLRHIACLGPKQRVSTYCTKNEGSGWDGIQVSDPPPPSPPPPPPPPPLFPHPVFRGLSKGQPQCTVMEGSAWIARGASKRLPPFPLRPTHPLCFHLFPQSLQQLGPQQLVAIALPSTLMIKAPAHT